MMQESFIFFFMQPPFICGLNTCSTLRDHIMIVLLLLMSLVDQDRAGLILCYSFLKYRTLVITQ